MTIGFTQDLAAYVGQTVRPFVRFSGIEATACSTNPSPILRFNSTELAHLGNQPAPLRHITNVELTYLAIRAPNLKWIPMILPDVFPNDISYNSVGTIRFATDVIVVDSGDDQRIQRWDQPLLEFDVSYGVRTMEQLQEMIAFYRAMRGRLYAFNYRDWLDYTSSMAIAYEAREAPPITDEDQLQLIGEGSTYIFQLVKNYAAPISGTTLVRPITRPQPNTVVISLSGANGGDWANNFVVDEETGIVTLLPTKVITAHNVTKNAVNTGQTVAFNAPAGTFSEYVGYDNYRVMISGFTNNENNVTVNQTCTIQAVAQDGTQLSVIYAQGGTSIDTAQAFQIELHPAPPPGVAVRAGFMFYVPCRFDTDQLPLTLEDYGIGSAQSIKLVEVRPTAF